MDWVVVGLVALVLLLSLLVMPGLSRPPLIFRLLERRKKQRDDRG